jgi:hypothetical protein
MKGASEEKFGIFELLMDFGRFAGQILRIAFYVFFTQLSSESFLKWGFA